MTRQPAGDFAPGHQLFVFHLGWEEPAGVRFVNGQVSAADLADAVATVQAEIADRIRGGTVPQPPRGAKLTVSMVPLEVMRQCLTANGYTVYPPDRS